MQILTFLAGFVAGEISLFLFAFTINRIARTCDNYSHDERVKEDGRNPCCKHG